jgi:hypothetical protein
MNIAEPVGVRAMFRFIEQRGALDIGGEYRFEGSRSAARRFLRDISQPGAARHFDFALVGFELPDNDLHQGRLARAVATD